MNNLLKDFKIQPTKLRGENMSEKELNEAIEYNQEYMEAMMSEEIFGGDYTSAVELKYANKEIEQLQQELTNLKAIEKEHQRMNGELREENKQLKENVNNAIERLEALIIFWKKYNPIDNTMQVGQFEGVIEILKGETNEK